MKKLALAFASLAVLTAAPAFAADLRRQQAPQPQPYAAVVPPFLWNGFYIGAQVGYAWGRDRSEEFVSATGLATGVDPRFSTSGALGGLHAGYNYQFSNLVFGIEGDIEASGIRGAVNVAAPNTSVDFDSRWQGSVRGRFGYAFGPSLFYVTGGVAFADLKHDLFVGAGPVERFRRTETGWTAGAGFEYALSPNWSTRLEYRYTDFGQLTEASAVAAPGLSYRHDPNFHTVRLGVSYRFGP